jgi:hypothetical protein
MRKLLTILFLITTFTANATIFYVNFSGGNDGNIGTTEITAWKNLSKVNAHTFIAGDIINFKYGERWYGALNLNLLVAGITIGAYGDASLPKPVITGFTTLTGWIPTGGNKYYTLVNADSTLNVVTVNGALVRNARTPNYDSANAGYRTYLNVGVSTNKIRDIAGVSVGDVIIVRQNDWRLVKVRITALDNDTATFAKVFDLANGGALGLEVNLTGFGWFKVNDTTDLNQQNEWAYNYTSKRFYLYSTVNPNTLTVKAATVDTLINIASKTNTTIQNIRFEGGNLYGFYGTTEQNLLFTGNEIEFCTQGIGNYRLYNSTISGNTIKNILQTGIYVQSPTDPYPNVTITGNTIDSVGLFAGQGSFNQASDYAGIGATVNNGLTCSYNTVSHTGREGIGWQGSNVAIVYNPVSYYCYVGQDRGGLYSYWDQNNSGNNVYYSNRRVAHNNISYGIGAIDGTPNSTLRASGIYMDGISGHVNIDSNTIWNFPRSGVNLNIDSAVNVRGNIITPGVDADYSLARSIGIQQQGTNVIRNFNFSGNTSYLSSATQSNIYYTIANLNGSSVASNVSAIGTINGNYYSYTTSAVFDVESYASPGSGFAFSQNTLAQWQTLSGFDIGSVNSGTSANTRLENNWSASLKPVYLDAVYKDVLGTEYSRTINVLPYSSLFLIYYSTLTPGTSTNIIRGVKYRNQ